jgi:hypothetical protein
MIYLGYGFKQPRPGRWVVRLQSSAITPASGADYAIAAQFHGGALLQTAQDITIPRVNETVTIIATLTADGAAVPLTNANAILHLPDGSTETLEMAVNGNQAELKTGPRMSGIYGIEVHVLAQIGTGNIIDRAAFLTLNVQPTWLETAKNQILAMLLGIGLLIVIVTVIRLRRRGRYQK